VAPLVVPIFPLPDVTFFPHTLLPLHVFEARYRAMVADTVERGGRLAVVQLRPGYEPAYAGRPAVHAVAGAGPIVSCERLSTGRYNIVVKGEARVRLVEEIPSDTLYRLVRVEPLEDVVPATDLAPAVARVRAACRRLLRALTRPPDLLDAALAEGLAPGAIADRIASAVIPDTAVRQELLETLDVGRRLERLVEALEALVIQLGGRE
jgi:Lon protease-like protein